MSGSDLSRHVVHPAFAVCLLVGSWLAVPPPPAAARATVAAAVTEARVGATTPAAPLAEGDGWGWRKLVGSTHNRARVIQIAVACMCFGLFILMRK